MIVVLMSTYNGEKYLREQIDSILNQQDVEVNLLIRDDGSTDNTINILKHYKNCHHNIDWYNGPNLGAGKSFYQLVLDAPESTYYAFADQDDVWDSNKLSIAITKLHKNFINVPSLYCSTPRPVDSDLKPIYGKRASPVVVTLGIALVQSISPGCTFVFNKLLLEKFREIGMEGVDIHDWALLRVTTAINGFIYFDNNPHFSYRQHENNVIGYKKSVISHWIGRLNRFSEKKYRLNMHNMAVIIKSVYYAEMTESNKNTIDTLINYKYRLANKIRLIKSDDIIMVNRIDNIVFKLLILFGLL